MNNMLKLLIVDDEHYVRSLVKLSIDWNKYNIQICGEADCAEEGLQLIEELEPDIVFSDICMEYMNGIEFCRKVLQSRPYIKFVFLTGHDDFNFASEGIKVGVTAYLLKPIEEDKIIEVILKIKKAIKDEHSQQNELLQLKSYLSDSKQVFVENCFNALVHNIDQISTTMKRLEYLNINFNEPYFQVCTIKLHTFDNFDNIEDSKLTDKNNMQLLITMECNEIVTNILSGFQQIFVFYDLNHTTTIISNNSKLPLFDILENIRTELKMQLSCNFSIGVGSQVFTLNKIKVSYQTAIEAVNYRSILGNDNVICYKDIQIENMDIDTNISQISLDQSISKLLNAIRQEQFEEAKDIINNCIECHIMLGETDILPIRILVSAVINHFSELLLQTGLQNSDAFLFCVNSYERVYKFETIEELRNLSYNLTRAIIETFNSERKNRSSSTINSILQYLKINYADANMTLNSVASHFYLNSSYLSRLFKIETNKTFTQHLTDIRMQEASNLVLNTTYRAYEISELVGFNDAKYFSTSFKKYYKMTTSEYRQVKGGVK